MLRLIVVLVAFVAMAYAGHHGHHGHHGGHHGHSPHGGWGWGKNYHGWANVNAWQTPWAYQYSLNEQGNGYNKYAWAQQDFKGWSG